MNLQFILTNGIKLDETFFVGKILLSYLDGVTFKA